MSPEGTIVLWKLIREAFLPKILWWSNLVIEHVFVFHKSNVPDQLWILIDSSIVSNPSPRRFNPHKLKNNTRLFVFNLYNYLTSEKMTFTENDLDVILETSFCNFEILFMKYLQYENYRKKTGMKCSKIMNEMKGMSWNHFQQLDFRWKSMLDAMKMHHMDSLVHIERRRWQKLRSSLHRIDMHNRC